MLEHYFFTHHACTMQGTLKLCHQEILFAAKPLYESLPDQLTAAML